MFGWGKRAPSDAAGQLRSERWQCKTCGIEHRWPFDLAAHAPEPWTGPPEYEPNGALRMDDDFLSEDFCILGGKHFLIRGVLPIPVHGMEDFGFGCWSTLSRANFDKYIAGFDSGDYPDRGPWSGWLCNQLADYVGPDPLALWVQPRPDRQRPLLWVQDDDHPLAIAQEEGITPDQAMELFRFYGHAGD